MPLPNTQESPNQKALNSAFPSDLETAIFDQSRRGLLASLVPVHGYKKDWLSQEGSLCEEESRAAAREAAAHAQTLLRLSGGQDVPARPVLSPSP